MRNGVAVELFYDGAWHDLVKSDDVLADTAITLQHGDGAESAAPRPQSAALRLNNDDDMFRVSNPESPLYGKAGVNTLLRVTVDGSVRGYTAIASWSCGQSPAFRPAVAGQKRGRAWTDVQGAGVLQRVNNWTLPLRSAFRVYNESVAGIVGYWPGEQVPGGFVAESVIGGEWGGIFQGQSFGSTKFPPGSGTQIDTQQGGFAAYEFTPSGAGSNAGWQYSIAIYMNDLGTSVVEPMLIATDTGLRIRCDIDPVAFTATIQITDTTQPTVPVIGTATVDVSDVTFAGRWFLWHMDVSASGGTVSVGVSWRAVTDDGFVGFTATYSGVTGNLLQAINSSLPDGSAYGHVMGVTGRPGLDSASRWDAFLGHPGETAGFRFFRLCTQENIPYLLSPNYGLSALMGPQKVVTLAEHFREIRDTDDALIFDLIDNLTVYFQARVDRYNQTPGVTLNAYANPSGMAALPTEVTDDLPIHNIVTVQNRDGGRTVLEDATSFMGTQDPPNGRGEYKQTINVNVASEVDQMLPLAQWYLNRGTVDRPRFPQVVVNLAALDAADRAAVAGVRAGNVLQIINFREYVVRLLVLGYREVIGWPITRQMVFTCVPDEIFGTIAVIGTTRIDASTTTLKTALGPTDTTATFRTVDVKQCWDTAAPPFDVVIAGQYNRVTAVGAASLVSGAYDQTVTLVRSSNGVRKALAAGEPISLATEYGRLAL